MQVYFFYLKGSKKLAEAEEVKFVSAMANNLAQQTKEATTKVSEIILTRSADYSNF